MVNLPLIDPRAATHHALRGWGPDGVLPTRRDDRPRPRRRLFTR